MLIEPIVSGGLGVSSVLDEASGSGLTFGFGGSVRLGIERQDIFFAIEPGVLLAEISPEQSGMIFTAGASIGGNLKYIPLRLTGTLQLASGYTDAAMSMGGKFAFRLGMGYFLSEKLLINLFYDRMLFGNVSGTRPKSLPLLQSADYNQVSLGLSMPFYLEQPEKPWKMVYRQKRAAEDARRAAEATQQPTEEQPAEPEQQPQPEAPQEPVAPPPAEAPAGETAPLPEPPLQPEAPPADLPTPDLPPAEAPPVETPPVEAPPIETPPAEAPPLQ